MESKDDLKEILVDIENALDLLGAEELSVFEHHWKLLRLYILKKEATKEGFQFLLNEIVSASPTLVDHRFYVLLSRFSTRFAPKPGQPQKSVPTQGLPPVHNEVVLDIAKKLEKLLKRQSK